MSAPPSTVPAVVCSWHCQAEVASVVKLSAAEFPDQEEDEADRERWVLLELPSESQVDVPCTLSLLCAAQGKDRILSISICSEARTVEVYGGSQDGQEEEYMGTSRGERLCTSSRGEDSPVILYKTYMKFEFPVASCTIKLLSLGGRCSVLVSGISVQMTSIPENCSQASYVPGSSINLDRVQSIMDSMGGKMSPGAEQLMNMVRAQQKNQAPYGAHLMQFFGSFQPGRNQMREDANQHTLLASNIPDTELEMQVQASQSPSSVQQPSTENYVKSFMSSLLQSSLGPDTSSHGPDSLVPLLRNLCGGNRKESCLAPKEEKADPALEKLLSAHMEHMERTLMAHIDQRMRSLQEHLDTRLDRLINLMQNNSLSENLEKLVNGQSDHGHRPEYDCGEVSM